MEKLIEYKKMTNKDKENVDRSMKYLESMLKEKLKNNVMDEPNDNEKLKLRVNLAKDLKRQGLEIPPDNIDIKW